MSARGNTSLTVAILFVYYLNTRPDSWHLVPGCSADKQIGEKLEDAKRIGVQFVMNTLRAITLRLDREDYERLEHEAARLGVPPATLARVYVRSRLNGDESEDGRRHRFGLEALDRLKEMTADLPPIDAVQVARESRDDLESRPEV